MECLEAIFSRRSVRKFLKKDVDDETVRKLLEAGNAAPSAGNLQARDFVVVRDDETKLKLAVASLRQMFIAQAPVVIVVVANYPRSMKVYGERGKIYAEQDAAAAVQNILLAAHCMGLASVWVGAYDDEVVSEILGIPSYARPAAILPVGYPAEAPEARRRFNIDELTHLERW
ncbi:nitroreductase family protein [Geoglobus acetivorans]|uniref:Nitroreductase family protein n=1 Tax=Geoglobus acetivorans TaxID=565033 RepID=A0ABZ3H4M8_GEOAI|nr:nitroreductase family protein [Geoglobus acetivorans]